MRQIFLRPIALAAAIAVAVSTTGCGTMTGIPSHGGGKRFATEQRLVDASIRGALKGIDVSALRGKKVALIFDLISDEGGGTLSGGRLNLMGALSAGFVQSPVTTATSAFQLFNVGEANSNYSNTGSGSSTSQAGTTYITANSTGNSSGTTNATSSGTNTGTSSGTNTGTSSGTTNVGAVTTTGSNTNTGTSTTQPVTTTTNVGATSSTTNVGGTSSSTAYPTNTTTTTTGATTTTQTTPGSTVTTTTTPSTNTNTTGASTNTSTTGTATTGVTGSGTSTSTTGASTNTSTGTSSGTSTGTSSGTNTSTGTQNSVGASSGTNTGVQTSVSESNTAGYSNTSGGSNTRRDVISPSPVETKTQTKGMDKKVSLTAQYGGLGDYQNLMVPKSDASYLTGLVRSYLILKGVQVVLPNDPSVEAVLYISVGVFGIVRSRFDAFIVNQETVLAETAMEMYAVDRSNKILMRPRTSSYEAQYDENYVMWVGPFKTDARAQKGKGLLIDFSDVEDADDTSAPSVKVEKKAP